MISISPAILVLLGFLLASLSAIVGAAAMWGALNKTVEQMGALIVKLEERIKSLEAVAHKLDKDVAILQQRDEWKESTGQHRPLPVPPR